MVGLLDQRNKVGSGLGWGKRGDSGRAALVMGCKSSEGLEMFGETGISQD